MAKVAAALFFIIITACCHAQQAELDSLLNVLKHHTKDDTVKVNLLNDIAFAYLHISPQKGIQAADEAIALAKQLGAPTKLASAYNYKGLNHSGEGEDSVALTLYNQALALHRQTHNTLRIGTTYNNMAISLVNLSRYAEALEYHTKAFAIFDSLHDEKRKANSLNNMGVIYLYVSDYDKALEYYFKALAVLEKLQDKNGIKNAYTNIGLVYDHLSNFSKSLEYHTRAFGIFKSLGDKAGMANALGNMGNVYHDIDSSAKALTLYTQAFAISEELGDKRGIASGYGNIGIVYNSMGNYAKALEYIEKSLALNTAADDKQRMAGDLNQLAKLYQQAPAAFLTEHGIAAGARYNTVVAYETRAITLAKQIGSVDIQRDGWQLISGVYEKQQNAAGALDAYKQYIILRDSVLNEETKLNITRKEMQFEFEKKEAIAQAENDKKQAVAAAEIHRQQLVRNIIIGGAGVLTIAALTSFVFYKKKRDALETQKEAEFNVQVSDTEMKALRAQMNPHFIFNSLNSISDYVDKYDTATATTYTAKFARLMRMILENSEKREVTIAEDLDALELYMQLEQLRLHHKFTYAIHIDEDIDKDNTFIPPLLLQPFVENSIWHGIAKKQGDGKIDIYIKASGNKLICLVEDDGIGRASVGQNKATGSGHKPMGINITRARIDILNRQKKVQAGVQLTYLEQGTRVELTLPLDIEI